MADKRGARKCRHCDGAGLEPRAGSGLRVTISRSGARRGELRRIARGAGVSESHLSNVLAGKKLPSTRTLLRLARFFGITMDRVAAHPAIRRRLAAGRGA